MSLPAPRLRAPQRRPLALLLAGGLLAGTLSAQVLSAPRTFPGDLATLPSVQRQSDVAISEGGPGFLAVWEDLRADLSGATNTPGAVGAGNMTDIYAARFDAAGNLLDQTPILVATQGMNQTQPSVAWNGSAWLVVWVTQRPSWYFFQDIVGVRVAADGTVLDPAPLQIRPEQSPSNNYGTNPSVASNGTDWLVLWEAIDFTDNKAIVEGARVAADGTLLDPSFRTLYKYSQLVFGPERPHAASLGGEYMVVWDNFGKVRARRFDSGLNPLGASFPIAGLNTNTDVAADAGIYLVLSGLRAVRLAMDGTVLDPSPIQIPNPAPPLAQGATIRLPDVAASGGLFGVTYAIPPSGSVFEDADVFLVRIAADGSVLDPTPYPVDSGPDSEVLPALAGDGLGGFLFGYQSRGDVALRNDDVHATFVHPDLTIDPTQDVAVGLRRQELLSWVRGPGVHLALFVSRASGNARILGQRFDDAGNALDAEPVLIHEGPEPMAFQPSGAWNGSEYLVTWLDATGLVLARRLTPDLQPIGFGATPAMQFMDGPPSVAALGNDFLITASDLFSGDQRWIKGIRIDGTTGATIEPTPFVVAFNFSFSPRVAAVGTRWLVVYTSRACHDCTGETLRARWVSSSGTPGVGFVVNGPGGGSDGKIAVAGNRALIAYTDPNAFLQDAIEARLVFADGTLAPSELLIADPVGRQLSPAVGFDGTQFTVAWSDYRTTVSVEQPRADIYAARVDLDGNLLDPGGGFPIATGTLSEDDAAVSSGASRTLIAYLAQAGAGGSAEVQRLHVRTLDPDFVCQRSLGFGGPGTTTLSMCGAPLVGTGSQDLVLDSPLPMRPAFFAYGPSLNPTSLLGGTLVPIPAARVIARVTDANGDVVIPGISGAGSAFTLYTQAVVSDPAQPSGFQISNALEVVALP